MKLGISGIAALALLVGCASAPILPIVPENGTDFLEGEPSASMSPDDMLCSVMDRSCWAFIPGHSMPEAYSAPEQSFAGVLSPQRVTP